MADVYTKLVEQILDISKGLREPKYIITARRMISGYVSKYRNGSAGLSCESNGHPLPPQAKFV